MCSRRMVCPVCCLLRTAVEDLEGPWRGNVWQTLASAAARLRSTAHYRTAVTLAEVRQHCAAKTSLTHDSTL